MISTSMKITEFLNEVATCGNQEIIFLADQEATAVERCLYRDRARTGAFNTTMYAYSEALKEFIVFIRYGVKSKCLSNLDLTAFAAPRKTDRKADATARRPRGLTRVDIDDCWP